MQAVICSNCGAPNFVAGTPGGRVKCSSCGNTFRVEMAYGSGSAGEGWGEDSEYMEASTTRAVGCGCVVVLLAVLIGGGYWVVQRGRYLVLDSCDQKLTGLELATAQKMLANNDGFIKKALHSWRDKQRDSSR